MNVDKHIINKPKFFKETKTSDIILKSLVYFVSFFVISFFIAFIIYIFYNGARQMKFLLTLKKENSLNIWPSLINTIYVEFLSLLVATPIGIATAIYLTQYKKNRKLIKIINFSVEILASMPSILLGLFGYNTFCLKFGIKPSILAASLTLSCCILPIIIMTSKEALLCVPKSYKQAAFSLGAGKLKVILTVVLPSAMPGIITAIILAMGRIIGESAALILTIGNSNKLPENLISHIFQGGKTLTLQLYYLAGNATAPNSMQLCFAIATILIVLIFILNSLTKLIINRFKK